MKLSIIIPIYNEAKFIDVVIKKIKSVTLPEYIIKEIVVINDGSTDSTAKTLEEYNTDAMVRIFHQDINMGKSAAVELGIKKSTGDIILIQDADLEYNPDDYPRLIEPIVKGRASIVYGSRFKGNIKKMAPINRIANILSKVTVNLLYHTKMSDVHTCYKIFKRDVLKSIKIMSRNFSFDTEITAKMLNRGYKIYEVPINYTARSKKEGKKITWLKAIETYWGLIKYRFKDNDS